MEFSNEYKTKIQEALNKKLDEISEVEIISEEDKNAAEELIFGMQIEEGELEKINFLYGTTALGMPFKRDGRIEFHIIEENAPCLLEFFKNSTEPKNDIKQIQRLLGKDGLKIVNEVVDKNRGIRKKDKPGIKENNEKMLNEMLVLREKGLSINSNVFWSIYIIQRGEKRKEKFIDDGRNIDEVLLINEFISDTDYQMLKDLRTDWYENNK